MRLFGEFVMIDVIVNMAYGRRRKVALGWGHVMGRKERR